MELNMDNKVVALNVVRIIVIALSLILFAFIVMGSATASRSTTGIDFLILFILIMTPVLLTYNKRKWAQLVGWSLIAWSFVSSIVGAIWLALT